MNSKLFNQYCRNSNPPGSRGPLERHYDRISAWYDLLDWPFEHFRYRHLRPAFCAGLRGKVLEAGVGTGRNLPYYMSGCEVTGVDLSPGQLSRAARRAVRARCRVELRRMDVTRLEFPDRVFDSCLSSFLFCVLPDELQLAALREILRVVRPGGLVRVLEYQYSARSARRLGMKLMAPLTWALFRARFDRATRAAVLESGAVLEREGFVSGDVIKAYDLRAPG